MGCVRGCQRVLKEGKVEGKVDEEDKNCEPSNDEGDD